MFCKNYCFKDKIMRNKIYKHIFSFGIMVLKIIEATQAKVGTNIMVDDMPCVVKKIDISKTGKHGHAKCRIEAVGILTGNKKVFVVPGHDRFEVPLVEKKKDRYEWAKKSEHSVGRVKSFYGNIGVIVRAYAYLRVIGKEGLKAISEAATLNANYLKEKLKKDYPLAVDEACLHEFVVSLKAAVAKGIHAGDIGKRLLDFGFHAPTVHFPLVVSEALMIEPTETESKETLDQFIEAMRRIAREIKDEPEKIKNAPYTMPVRRPNDVLAARKPILTYRDVRRDKALKAEAHI